MYILLLQVASFQEDGSGGRKKKMKSLHQSGRSLGYIWPLNDTISKQS